MVTKNSNNAENLEKGQELYNEIISFFSYSKIKDESLKSRLYPTSYGEVVFARGKISEIQSLQIDDAEFLRKLEELKNICDQALKRKFKASIPVLIAAGIFMIMNVYMAYNNMFKNMEGFYKPGEAGEIYNKAVELSKKQVEYYQSIIYKEDSKKWLDYHAERLKSLENLSPQDFLNQKNLELRNETIKNIKIALLSIVLFLAYIFASRAPVFLVYKRRKKLDWEREKGYSAGLLNSVFSSLLAIPVEEARWNYKEKLEDGRVIQRSGTDMGASSGFIKILFIVFLLIAVFYIMLIALPFLILANYLRNYQYIFMEKASSGILSLLHKRKHPIDEKPEFILNTVKRIFPVLEGIKKADLVLARYSNDNYLYSGTIEDIKDQSLLICYNDGSREDVLKTDTCLVSYGIKNLSAEANWQNAGVYYKCTIAKDSDDLYLVKYEDKSTEKLSVENLRFY